MVWILMDVLGHVWPCGSGDDFINRRSFILFYQMSFDTFDPSVLEKKVNWWKVYMQMDRRTDTVHIGQLKKRWKKSWFIFNFLLGGIYI